MRYSGNSRLANKRAVITGAGSGIGAATAIRYAREGACVALVDVDESAAKTTGKAIEALGLPYLVLPADVSDEQQIADAIQTTTSTWGGLDILVANAGIQLFGADTRAHDLEIDVWNATIAVNLTGVFLTCKHGIRAMLDSGEGSVICTGSPTGLFGMSRGFDAYSASKAGVIGLARVMANDYAADGIRVNVVVPGFTDTTLVSSIFTQPEEVSRRLKMIPLGRVARPEEVSGLMAFLASDDSAYATGGIFCIDGGVTAV
jgi:NAD(P)-dependent dehydrogenase (short-subunit alcohol dehydrogenase family)